MIDVEDEAYRFLESVLWKEYRKEVLGIGKDQN